METPTRCLYPSKPCINPRSLKDDGELHRLCKFHRIKANDAQRRWHLRQRASSRLTPSPSTSDVESEMVASKLVLSKRRRTPPSDKSEHASETLKRRRRCKPTALTQPSKVITALAPLPSTFFTGLLTSSSQPEGSAINNDELVLLCDFIGELEESTLHTDFDLPTTNSPGIGYKNEWWLANQHATEATIYSL